MACFLVALVVVSVLCLHISDAIKSDRSIKSSGSVPKRKKASMLKAFWLTLIDPSNEESLKEEGKRRVADIKNKSKLKGRSLKD